MAESTKSFNPKIQLLEPVKWLVHIDYLIEIGLFLAITVNWMLANDDLWPFPLMFSHFLIVI